MTTGQRVTTADGAGRIYTIEYDWAGVILDSDTKRNPSIYWARLEELTPA